MPDITALIAEDEPLLALALQTELQRQWPELRLLATVGDGLSAVRQALQLRPDVLFLDIRMPGQSGIEAAAELAEQWPTGAGAPPFPALVFVTAYDQYAVQAFEAQAVDYVLKPVQGARLLKTVQRVQQVLAGRQPSAPQPQAVPADLLEPALAQLRQLLAAQIGQHGAEPATGAVQAPAPSAGGLKVIQASLSGGSSIRLVPIEEVVYFEAADKYVRVLTATEEYLIRTPLKELIAQLDTQVFWQIHRGTLVRASAIDTVTRDEAGKLRISLRGRAERLGVSRLYAHLFKAM
ncbi:MAG: response regulator transcription factor [Curvibacter lanceolatus]|jgi:DNA-binding LytR/AlgR family response regulator|uniref:LytR/AlgR family response regulator transcription factor n=1 Tax=Curvibacter lanceolatus TaxID=86182 RepID=UPI00036F3D79|nr:LytTR family DNA-binding domain-containing protein [Curvibacter lanceolatus]MBV5294520.1 response regulator transcription factor [Curvibacter lanceolatus]